MPIRLPGYELLRRGRAADAAAILRLNAEEFARSPNAQDSLREACGAAGDRDGATAAARKTLELLESDATLPAGFRHALEENARKTLEASGKN